MKAPDVVIRTVNRGLGRRGRLGGCPAPPAIRHLPRVSVIMYADDLEPHRPSRWPRRLTVAGYLGVAVVVVVALVSGIQLPSW